MSFADQRCVGTANGRFKEGDKIIHLRRVASFASVGCGGRWAKVEVITANVFNSPPHFPYKMTLRYLDTGERATLEFFEESALGEDLLPEREYWELLELYEEDGL